MPATHPTYGKNVQCILVVWAALAGPADTLPAAEEGEGKPPRTEDRVQVTAEVGESTSGPLGGTSTTLDPRRGAPQPSTVTDLVGAVPGVADNGQGGLFQVFSVRGVSRQRVQSQLAGARIVSDRRAGGTFTFVDPLLLGEIEVLQGASSTFHGSGALGGVVQGQPRSFPGWSVESAYDSDGDENVLLLGNGGESWSVGIARRDAGEGEAADGTRLHSGFTQYSAVARRAWGAGPRRYELLYIPSYGEEIGKSSTDFPERTTTYPRERHQLLKLSVSSQAGWRTHAYVHAHDLETRVVEEDAESLVSNDSLDYGLRWEHEAAPGERITLTWGADAIGRSGVDSEETLREAGMPEEHVVSLDGADEIETGLFAALRTGWERTRLEAGARLSAVEQDAAGRDVSESALDGRLGLMFALTPRLELGGSLASGVRFPGLGERFFSGTTGRGTVIGNPALDIERSLSAEASLRWLGRKLLVRGVLFRSDVDDYVERVEIMPDVLTFVNLTSGTIEGLELHGVALPARGWKVTFGGHAMEGRDDDDRPLADVPGDEVFAGVERERGRWSVRGRWAHRWEKDDPGSGEKRVPSAESVSAAVSFQVSAAWSLSLTGENLLDDETFRAADRKAPLAPGRSWGLRLSWRQP